MLTGWKSKEDTDDPHNESFAPYYLSAGSRDSLEETLLVTEVAGPLGSESKLASESFLRREEVFS